MNTDDVALIVDEPIDGHFYWILQQRNGGDGNPRPVDAAPGPMPTYGSALMAGISALQRRTQVGGPVRHGLGFPVVHAMRRGPVALGPSTVH